MTEQSPSQLGSRCSSTRDRRAPFVLIGLWLLALSGWFAYLTWYANAPGAVGAAPMKWPVESFPHLDRSRTTVMMFLHPRCPCTESSLEELSRIITRCPDAASYYCVFVRPAGEPEGWEHGALWRQASAIPKVQIVVDDEGREAKRFGAMTSGVVFVFKPGGELAFEGGITGARNHAGDNHGASAVIQWVSRGQADSSKSFVFGCPLF